MTTHIKTASPALLRAGEMAMLRQHAKGTPIETAVEQLIAENEQLQKESLILHHAGCETYEDLVVLKNKLAAAMFLLEHHDRITSYRARGRGKMQYFLDGKHVGKTLNRVVEVQVALMADKETSEKNDE